MKLRRVTFLFVAALAVHAHAQESWLPQARVTPDDLKWAKQPAGFEVATATGNPQQRGMYSNQVRFPAGTKIMPHFHPDERIIVVLSGTVYFGYGETFDESKMKALPAGSVWTEPAKQPHFAWAKDGEATIQVIGNGPSGTVNIPQGR